MYVLILKCFFPNLGNTVNKTVNYWIVLILYNQKTLILLHEEKQCREPQGGITGDKWTWQHHLLQLPNTGSIQGSSSLVTLPNLQSSGWTFPHGGNIFWKTLELKDSPASVMEPELYFVPKEFELPLLCHPHATEQGQATACFFEGALLESGTRRLIE